MRSASRRAEFAFMYAYMEFSEGDRENIATGETSPAITTYHFFGNSNFFNFHH